MTRGEISEVLGVQMGSDGARYLGLPFLIGRTRREIFQYIEDRVRKKISGWKEKFLSSAGKEVLIKSVLQAIPNYVMQCFILPSAICDKITSLTRSFWWTNSGKNKAISWVAWDKMCETKGGGGMGFKDIRAFNLAMIAKQGWRYIQNPESLVARVLRSKYFAHSSFMQATKGTRPSYLWRSILQGRDVLQLGLRHRIGRGQTVSIWNDPWIPRPFSFKPIAAFRDRLPYGHVSDIIVQETGTWNTPLLANLFLPLDIEIIQSIPIGHENASDTLIWHHTSHGRYTVHSGYTTYMDAKRMNNGSGQTANNGRNKNFWTKVWSTPTLPKVRTFMWRMVKEVLPTATNLNKRIPAISPQCPNCGSLKEDEFHCVVECTAAAEVWMETFPHILDWQNRSIGNMIEQFAMSWDREALCYFSLLCWYIWKSRCMKLYEGKSLSTISIISQAAGLANDILSVTDRNETLRHIPEPLTEAWCLPKAPFISVSVDSGFGELGMRACGVLFRDSSGAILQASTILLPSEVDVLQGELLAILRGMELALSHGFSRIVVWSDCLSAVNLLEHNDEPLHPLAYLVVECTQYMSQFQCCVICFTRREFNNPAHLLARWGLLHSTSMDWGPNPPPYVLEAAVADLR